MAWVKIDDQAPRNEKLLRAGPAAAWLWLCGIAHGQAQMTEGFIADISLSTIGVTGADRSRKLAEVLVSCGLFERVEGGYQVHDYLEHNETREEALARKVTLGAKRAASGRLGGLAKVANAKQTVVANPSPDPTRPDRTKNPPTPFQGARRYLRADLKEAQRIRKMRFGRCEHDPTCEDHIACEVLLAIDIADRRKAAAS